MKKRLLSFLLALMICLALLPLCVPAEEDRSSASGEVSAEAAAGEPAGGETILEKPKISGVSGSAGAVTVSWSEVKDAKVYFVFRRVNGAAEWTELGSTADMSFTDGDTPVGAKYIYAVCCESDAGAPLRSELSGARSITLELDAPTLRSAKCAAGTGIRVTWSKVAGAARYAVLRRDGGSSGWKRVGTTAGTIYTDTTCEAGAEYTYSVRCLSADGAVSVSRYDRAGKTAVYLLPAPQLKEAANAAAGVRLSWKPTDGAVRYQILRKEENGGWTALDTTTGTTYTDRTACSGQTYSYTVCCVSGDGGTVTGEYDAAGRTAAYLAAPKLTKLRTVYAGVRLTWDAVDGAARYCVYRRARGDADWTRLGMTKDTSCTDKNTEPGTTYAYTVRAIGGSAVSAVRAGRSVTAAEIDWRLVLVNAWNPLPEDYGIELTRLSNGTSVDSRVYPDLQAMFDDMRARGVYPVVREGYRTHEEQEAIMQNRVERYAAQGYSRETAESLARLYVAEPGTSEHELGLAVDINAASGYSEWSVYTWLADNAWRYGFILRYPEGKEDITGIEYEPWHYRYVGAEAAAEIYEKGLTLEEYLGEA